MGSGNRIRVFDGKDLLSMDEGENEFTRVKRHTKDDDTETGLVQSLRIIETIENERSSYRREIKYGLRRVGYGTGISVNEEHAIVETFLKEQGAKGFGELRKLLKKAGLHVN